MWGGNPLWPQLLPAQFEYLMFLGNCVWIATKQFFASYPTYWNALSRESSHFALFRAIRSYVSCAGRGTYTHLDCYFMVTRRLWPFPKDKNVCTKQNSSRRTNMIAIDRRHWILQPKHLKAWQVHTRTMNISIKVSEHKSQIPWEGVASIFVCMRMLPPIAKGHECVYQTKFIKKVQYDRHR